MKLKPGLLNYSPVLLFAAAFVSPPTAPPMTLGAPPVLAPIPTMPVPFTDEPAPVTETPPAFPVTPPNYDSMRFMLITSKLFLSCA